MGASFKASRLYAVLLTATLLVPAASPARASVCGDSVKVLTGWRPSTDSTGAVREGAQRSIENGRIRQRFLHLVDQFGALAKHVLAHSGLDQRMKGAFAADMDRVDGHNRRFHAYSIREHTLQTVLRLMNTNYLGELGIQDLGKVLDEKIEGVSKRDLFHIGMLLHDIGKYSTRQWPVSREDGKPITDPEKARQIGFGFEGHEAAAEGLIRAALSGPTCVLTTAQIDYIVAIAKYHFELGIVRRSSPEEINLTNIAKGRDGAIYKAIVELIKKYAGNPDVLFIIGASFYVDNQSKAPFNQEAGSDADIAAQRDPYTRLLNAIGFGGALSAVQVTSLNVALARLYFQALRDIQSGRGEP